MKALKYILHILAFMLINIAVTFIAPSVVSGRVAVCVVIGIAPTRYPRLDLDYGGRIIDYS